MAHTPGYVHLQSESGLWTVGHYSPNGTWHPESDHDTPNLAAERVHYLNGGRGVVKELLGACRALKNHKVPMSEALDLCWAAIAKAEKEGGYD